MTSKISIKTTFEPAKTIEPIYTGGDVSLDKTGRLLATCVDEDALIVNIQTGERILKVENDGESITSLALSSSASHLVVCSRSLSMRIYGLNGPTVELQRTLKPHTTPVITSVFDATGTLLATGGADGTIKVWDIRGGYATHTFHGHGGIISALHFFKNHSERGSKVNGKRKSVGSDQSMTDTSTFFLASGSEDGKIRIWNLQTRKSVVLLDSHVSVVKSLDFSEQQQTLLSASRDKTIILWDSQSWKPRKIVPVLEVVEAAGFVLDGEYYYSGGENGIIRVWSILGKETTKEQSAASENDSIVNIQRGPNFLLSVHLDQTIRFHDLQALEGSVTGASIDSLPVVRRVSGNHDEIIDMALVGPERSLVALATNTESVRIISIADSATDSLHNFGADVALLSGHSEIIICLDVDWSGHWLATGAKDNSARLWRLDPSNSSYTCFAIFVGHAESLGAVALPRTSPSPQALTDPLSHPPAFLITGSQDRTIKRWDTSKLTASSQSSPHSVSKSFYTRVAHEKDINAIDVSATSLLFASASQDKSIKIWDLDSGSTMGILRGHKRGVWSIRFAPKDTPSINSEAGSNAKGLLVSGSGDRTVKLWSLSTYTCILTFEGHSNSVLKVIWLSPTAQTSAQDGDDDTIVSRKIPQKTHPIIASASSDTLIKLWSPYTSSATSATVTIADDHLLTTLDNHTDRVWALATPTTVTSTMHPKTVSPSSSSSSILTKYPLISGSADATLSLWIDTTTSTLRHATAVATARVEQDQALQNHIRARNYREAITLSLTLNHPGRLLTLFEELIANHPLTSTTNHHATDPPISGEDTKDEQSTNRNTSITGSSQADEVLSQLSHSQLYTLLLRVRDWNANARTAPVAQRILNLILKSYPISTFTDMARRGKKFGAEAVPSTALAIGDRKGRASEGTASMRDLLRALEAYTERHLRRMEELVDESYLIEYTLGCMDDVLGVDTGQAMPDRNGEESSPRAHGRGEEMRDLGSEAQQQQQQQQQKRRMNGRGDGDGESEQQEDTSRDLSSHPDTAGDVLMA